MSVVNILQTLTTKYRYIFNNVVICRHVTNPIDTLFEDFAVDILVIISKNPGLKRTELYSMLGSTSNTPRKLTTQMIEDGLIEETQEKRFNVKTLKLTVEGERFLSLIGAMMDGRSIEPTNYGASGKVRDSVKG